jgi:hypothetical protein
MTKPLREIVPLKESEAFPEQHPGFRKPDLVLKMTSGPDISIFPKKKKQNNPDVEVNPKLDSSDEANRQGRGSSKAARTYQKYVAGTGLHPVWMTPA